MKKFFYRIVSFAMTMIVALTAVGLSEFSLSASAASVSEGLYVIQSSLNTSKVLDITNRGTSNGSNCQLYDRNNTAAQVFRVIPVDEVYYIIQLAMTNDMVLDVSGGKGYNGCNVQLYKYNGTDAQLWSFEASDSDYYYIKSKTGYYLDVTDGKTTNGTNLQVYVKNMSNPNYQRFKFVQNYNATNAVKYAEEFTDSSGQYSGTYNSTFNIYKKPNPKAYWGFDCANFASQCIFNGGFIATDQWKPVYRGEDYRGDTAKTNWVSANDLYSYLSSIGYPTQRVKSDLSNIHIGDIVFTGQGHHATICTGYSNGNPIYCAHSKWRKDFAYDYNDFMDGYVIDMSFATCDKVKCSSPSSSNVNYSAYTIGSSSGAKVRTDAGTSYSQVGGLSKGSVVYYDKIKQMDGYTWYHITSVSTKSGSWGRYVGYWVAGV